MLQTMREWVLGRQFDESSSFTRQIWKLPKSCPFSFRQLNKSLYLIREHDDYGQYPNIYVKVCRAPRTNLSSEQSTVIVLSDTGCATQSNNLEFTPPATPQNPQVWNIRTVLEFCLNPGGRIPYLVITTHCHFDHIMGIGLLPPTDQSAGESALESFPPTTVLSSAYDRDFIDPWSHLCKHSLTEEFHLQAPHYTIGIWAEDHQCITYIHSLESNTISTGIEVLHTPGHTPDSLSWYDSTSQLLCVGDSFYETTSQDTSNVPWGPEPRAAIIFEERSDLFTWWNSLTKIIEFVKAKNGELFTEQQDLSTSDIETQLSTRVAICAAHVTTSSPNAEAYLASIQLFMSRILKDEVPCKSLPDSPLPFKDLWCWDDKLDETNSAGVTSYNHGPPDVKTRPDVLEYDWIVQAPRRIIEEGRERIPKEEWA